MRPSHSRLTQAYSMDKSAEKPKCDVYNCRLSIKHILVDCPKRKPFLDDTTAKDRQSNHHHWYVSLIVMWLKYMNEWITDSEREWIPQSNISHINNNNNIILIYF